jgi:hypothetical protein
MLPRYWLPLGLISLVPSALLASCGSGSGGDGGGSGSGCPKVSDKLQSCHLIPSGATFACSEPSENAALCEGGCFTNVSCGDLAGYFCSGLVLASFDDCLMGCLSFTCKNGEIIGADLRCNGHSDCGDGSDEAGCASTGFTCKNGATIQDSSRCDSFLDCQDGSDEDGCPTFTCKNGEKVLATERCDGHKACADGSDEDGCPPTLRDIITCPSPGP